MERHHGRQYDGRDPRQRRGRLRARYDRAAQRHRSAAHLQRRRARAGRHRDRHPGRTAQVHRVPHPRHAGAGRPGRARPGLPAVPAGARRDRDGGSAAGRPRCAPGGVSGAPGAEPPHRGDRGAAGVERRRGRLRGAGGEPARGQAQHPAGDPLPDGGEFLGAGVPQPAALRARTGPGHQRGRGPPGAQRRRGRRLSAPPRGERRRGYAVNYGETSVEEVGVAAPVFDHRGEAVASVLVSAPRFRVSPEGLPVLGETVRESAARVTARLGGRRPTSDG
nr:IclR family transcriptional regulator C-terminal domain-containing protein [Streptomyces sp. HYC2]